MSEIQFAFIELAKLSQLFDGYRKTIRVNDRDLLLVQTGGRVYVIENRCPHMDASLSRGSLSSDGTIRCPVHGIEFKLDDGLPCGPLAGSIERLRRFKPVYEGNRVGIMGSNFL